jgi:hypothetical protein
MSASTIGPIHCVAAIGRVLVLFSGLMRPRAYVIDRSLAGMPARAPSMLLDTIRVGPNTYMGVSRACDEAMAALSSVARAFLDPFLRGVTFWATEGLDELLENKANQQCHFKTYRALDLNVSTGIVMGTVPMTIPVDTFKSSAL